MLNTSKLLYILPDVAIIVELLAGKKPHTFAVQSFRQINGQYIGEDEFVGPNIVKLFSKLEPDAYHLILPDSVFTNTIVTVQESSDNQIATYLRQNLLPSLDLSTKTHQIDTTVLTTFKGQSKVQLSALEQDLLSPLRAAADFAKVEITAISPLSWTVKALISLEPSISILQLGSNLYTAEHYIGVDQATEAPTSDVEAIAETIRTLKGSEPNIQTIYLFSNELIEEKLKELLSDALPIQQLATMREDDEQLPAYVKEIVESGMKTLSISDYPVPSFTLGKATADDKAAFKAEGNGDTDNPEQLPAPDTSQALPPPDTLELPATFADDADAVTSNNSVVDTETDPSAVAKLAGGVVVSETKKIDLHASDVAVSDTESDNKEPNSMPPSDAAQPETQNTTDTGVDVSQFAAKPEVATAAPSAVTPPPATPAPTVPPAAQPVAPASQASSSTPPPAAPPSKPTPIKNQSGVSTMLKMVLITIVVFIVTVAIGVGIGVILLKVSQGKSGTAPAPTPEPTVAVAVSPTAPPTPTLAPVNVEETSVKVVNATTKAGYAGEIAAKLEAAGYGTVTAGNANGEYASASADLALMEQDNPALVAQLSESTGLSLTYSSEGYAIEDPQGTYDAVIVLTQP